MKKSNRFAHLLSGVCVGLALLFASGCESQPLPSSVSHSASAGASDLGPVLLREGDVIKVAFPGSPNLDTTQPIRRDGRVTLPVIGEVQVVGKTPIELEKSLLELYANQIVSKEISVSVISSSYPVYLDGAVRRPGKLQADRPMTALEAILESGGFDSARADARRVRVIRYEGNQTKYFTLDLKAVLDGQPADPFYLKPGDIISVPERFNWF